MLINIIMLINIQLELLLVPVGNFIKKGGNRLVPTSVKDPALLQGCRNELIELRPSAKFPRPRQILMNSGRLIVSCHGAP